MIRSNWWMKAGPTLVKCYFITPIWWYVTRTQHRVTDGPSNRKFVEDLHDRVYLKYPSTTRSIQVARQDWYFNRVLIHPRAILFAGDSRNSSVRDWSSDKIRFAGEALGHSRSLKFETDVQSFVWHADRLIKVQVKWYSNRVRNLKFQLRILFLGTEMNLRAQ